MVFDFFSFLKNFYRTKKKNKKTNFLKYFFFLKREKIGDQNKDEGIREKKKRVGKKKKL